MKAPVHTDLYMKVYSTSIYKYQKLEIIQMSNKGT